jgi:hypothetical protein
MAQSPVKRSRAEILLSWEIEGLKTYAGEVLPYLESRISQTPEDLDDWIRPDGSLSERELLRSAYDIALFSVNERLNAIVDGMLLHAARIDEDLEPQEQAGAQNRSRTILGAQLNKHTIFACASFLVGTLLRKFATTRMQPSTVWARRSFTTMNLALTSRDPSSLLQTMSMTAFKRWIRGCEKSSVLRKRTPSNQRLETDLRTARKARGPCLLSLNVRPHFIE